MQALETFEMSCVRSILNISRILHIPSSELRHRLRLPCTVRECVVQSRIRYFGHIWRMGGERVPKAVLYYDLDVRRGGSERIGRPQRTWVHCIHEDLGSRGLGIRAAGRLALTNRDAFRCKVVLGYIYVHKLIFAL